MRMPTPRSFCGKIRQPAARSRDTVPLRMASAARVRNDTSGCAHGSLGQALCLPRVKLWSVELKFAAPVQLDAVEKGLHRVCVTT